MNKNFISLHKKDKENNCENGQSCSIIPILSSQNKRSFQGFLVCIGSFTGLCHDLES